MVLIRRLVLDVLSPHDPSILELSRLLAECGEYHVKITVVEMDDRTETLQIEISGVDVDFDCIQTTISEFGASLHSIDEVEVENQPEPVT